MTTMTRLDRNIQEAEAYLNKILGTRYELWTGGIVPPGPPAWGRNGEPPDPAEVRRTSCFCAGVTNLARRAVGLEIPTLGNENFDGGVVAYFGATGPAPPDFPRQGYFERHGRQRRFNLEDAQRPWTLIGRKYRSVADQGHVAIVLPNGKLLQSYNGPGGRPGVNKDVSLRQSHFSWGPQGGYEYMVYADDWLLPFDAERERPRPEPERPEPERPEPERPEPERPEPERPVRPEPEKPERVVVLFTARQLSQISENPDLATLERYRKALIPEMQKAGITTHLRVAAFLGNVVQETDRLQTLEEYGTESYFRSFLGDQWRYHGRGFLMNTWRDAYARLSQLLKADLVANPDLLTRPDLAAKAATWFWSQHKLNAYADRGEFKKVCAIINTGSEWGQPNGLDARLRFYDRAKRVLPRSMGGRGTIPNGYNHDGFPYINLAAVEQADETAAFALATEIRRVGIGVTVTNGAENVGALAEILYDEPLGYRQLWIVGEPALDACGDYGDLANWPISPKTDYYNLAGRDFSGTCRRAAELADEKVKEGVGQKFLEEMGLANHGPTKPSRPAPPPPKGRDEERDSGYAPPADYSQEPEESPSYDGDTGSPSQYYSDERRREREDRGRRDREREDREPGDREPRDREHPEPAAGIQESGSATSFGALIDSVRNNKALLTWLAGAVVAWLIGNGYLAPELKEQTSADVIAGLLLVLGLLARQMAYGPVTVEKEYNKKDK